MSYVIKFNITITYIIVFFIINVYLYNIIFYYITDIIFHMYFRMLPKEDPLTSHVHMNNLYFLIKYRSNILAPEKKKKKK